MADLTSNGFVDQIGRFDSFGYSYVFDGAAGRLDHALASPSLSTKIAKALEWHINADEPSVIDYNTEFKPQDLYSATPYRASDHDPVVVGVNLRKIITGTRGHDGLFGSIGDDFINGGFGDDQLTGGEGDDVLVGGPGADLFVYQTVTDGRDIINDFVPGQDRIDLRALLASVGYSGTDPVADRYVRFIDRPAGAELSFDADGRGQVTRWVPLAVLKGVVAASIVPSRDLVISDVAYMADLNRQRRAR